MCAACVPSRPLTVTVRLGQPMEGPRTQRAQRHGRREARPREQAHGHAQGSDARRGEAVGASSVESSADTRRQSARTPTARLRFGARSLLVDASAPHDRVHTSVSSRVHPHRVGDAVARRVDAYTRLRLHVARARRRRRCRRHLLICCCPIGCVIGCAITGCAYATTGCA